MRKEPSMRGKCSGLGSLSLGSMIPGLEVVRSDRSRHRIRLNGVVPDNLCSGHCIETAVSCRAENIYDFHSG